MEALDAALMSGKDHTYNCYVSGNQILTSTRDLGDGFNNWLYYREVAIGSSADGELTEYQLSFNLNYGAGVTTGNTVYFDSKCNTDFSDVRVTDSRGITVFTSWLETPVSGTSATMWVNVDGIPASGGLTLRLYYGKSTATDISSGNTFDYFEDFTNNKSRLMPFGNDSSWAGGFDPVSRRMYLLGFEDSTGQTMGGGQWVNVDTGESGIIWPGHPSNVHGFSVVYHPTDELFYCYGGYDGYSNIPFSDGIVTFDPATETWATLTETLPTGVAIAAACYDSASGDIFIFGGATRIGTWTRTDLIARHDISANTCTDTGANLNTASWGHAVAQGANGSIYLFGGAETATPVSRNSIYKYDPSAPGTDPALVSGQTLSVNRDTAAACAKGNNIYIFGGYDYGTATYYDSIDKFDASTDTISTISETLYQADDDFMAEYDSTDDVMYIGPVRHSVGGASDLTKVAILEFDPDTDTFASEPTLGAVPSGWSEDGTEGSDSAVAINGTYLALQTFSASAYPLAAETYTALSGKVVFEFSVQALSEGDGTRDFNPTTHIKIKTTGTNFSTEHAIDMINGGPSGSLNTWKIEGPAGTYTDIAAIPKGQHVVSAKLDTVAETYTGLVDRANETASKAWVNAAVNLDQVWLYLPTATKECALFDWCIQRKWTTNEPTISVGSEVTT